MNNYCMKIAYDGTRYRGWQRLGSGDCSVQGKIEDVLSRMCNHNVTINGAGRTDGGVHAQGQVASFKIDTDKTDGEIMDYLNGYLPEDIAVTELYKTDDRFHARYNAKEKTYLYRINNTNISNVFERKYMYWLKEKLDINKMREAADMLLGVHDFLGFSAVKKVKKSTVRTIYSIEITGDNMIEIYIKGDGFLYNMVRIIVGTLIEIGLGKRDIRSINKALETKKREDAGYTAPSHGLTLYEVKY